MGKVTTWRDERGGLPIQISGQEAPADRGTARAKWLISILALVILLAALGYAEAVWLHQLPQDRATRIALVAFPGGSEGAAQTAASDDWSERLMRSAADPELIEGVIAKLNLLDAATDQPLSADALLANMRLGSHCIELSSDQGSVRGLLLYNVVRGTDASTTDGVAVEWSARLIERSAADRPGLVVKPVDSLGVPYEICR